ncbi:uncharacterized protein A4U43_C01F25900 [Asparagus officinalis]|uniref:VQ domain-containing protein n=1 Tax=Asparagus officinalis TaxID=4686 RepID=A0A5P1FSG0_ASPOF|nr:uncharacterized protein A4U43_C01F25900 [Asparagus officinalis]
MSAATTKSSWGHGRGDVWLSARLESREEEEDGVRLHEREKQQRRAAIIETHKVHTDVTHFKSVVQCLTGKDSVVGKTSERSSSSQGVQVQQKSEEGGREGKGEFDDILKMKLPSLDELKEFWDD